MAREHDYEKTEGVMKKTFERVVEYSIKPLLPQIKKPILVLWGENDKMTPAKDVRFIQKNSKDVNVIIYNNFGHTLPYINHKKLAGDIDLWYTQIR